MKKIFLILGLVAITILSNAHPSEKVSAKVLASFKSEFSTAKDVQWETGTSFFMAAFSLHDQRIFAYYTPDGALISVIRHISSTQLPINLFSNIKNDYSKYWISELFESSNSDGVHYYVTLETADAKLTLQSENGGSWKTYSKIKKI